MLGYLAIVLHAHLPYVRHPEHLRPLEERWLHEALWESYLPLLGMIERLAELGVHTPIAISVSPTLASMLRDDLLRRRFEEHLDRLDRLAARLEEGSSLDQAMLENAGCTGEALAFYRQRLAEMRALWERIDGDLLSALASLHDEGRIELWTSTATHAYLPGLCASPASIRAQLRLGLRAFERLSGVRPQGLWLPECAYDPRFLGDLAAAGVNYTILDAHGLLLARPRPPFGVSAPILSPKGVAFFARDPASSRDVWSREVGYPGDPVYREFYRDVGFDLPAEALELEGELGPHGTRLMTGLKLFRITGAGPHKELYRPAEAAALAARHARHFVRAREAMLAEARAHNPAPILVAPFDAELFGHWWFEGPLFLEHVLIELDASARRGVIAATTVRDYLAHSPHAAIAEPAPSSWGEGGFGEVWTGASAARLWRHVHHGERIVRAALEARREASGLSGRALDQAIRELMLLEASDWAFMLHRREMTEYAEARVRAHMQRLTRLSSIARSKSPTVEDLAYVHAVCDRDRFLADLNGEELRDAFDPWQAG